MLGTLPLTVADLEGGRAGSALPPPYLGHGLTPSLMAMLANKIWYSEYSK